MKVTSIEVLWLLAGMALALGSGCASGGTKAVSGTRVLASDEQEPSLKNLYINYSTFETGDTIDHFQFHFRDASGQEVAVDGPANCPLYFSPRALGCIGNGYEGDLHHYRRLGKTRTMVPDKSSKNPDDQLVYFDFDPSVKLQKVGEKYSLAFVWNQLPEDR